MNKRIPPLSMFIRVSEKDGKPRLILTRQILNAETIKSIVYSMYYQQPIIIYPQFTDKLKGMNSLIKKGIISYTDDGDFAFNI